MAVSHMSPIVRSAARAPLLALALVTLTAATLPYEPVLLDLPDAGLPQQPTFGAVTLDQTYAAPLGLPVSNPELDAMRGKYISPEAVSYFGISMLTSWQDENGITTAARLAFNVDFLNPAGGGAPVPQLLIAWERNGDSAMDVAGVPDGYVAVTLGPDQVLPVGALDTVGGAVQANVIAGADNITRNSMQIAVVPMSAVPNLSADGLTPVSATTTRTFDDGDQLQFRLGDNQVGLVLTGGNGMDSTMQSVGGDLGQLLQQTMLQSDNTHVFNSSAIIFGVDTARNLDRVQTDEALLSMKGFGF